MKKKKGIVKWTIIGIVAIALIGGISGNPDTKEASSRSQVANESEALSASITNPKESDGQESITETTPETIQETESGDDISTDYNDTQSQESQDTNQSETKDVQTQEPKESQPSESIASQSQEAQQPEPSDAQPQDAQVQNNQGAQQSESMEVQNNESQPPSITDAESSVPEDSQNVGSGSGNNNFNTYDNSEQQETTDTYVLNTSRMKIHYPNCSSVPKIAPQNYDTSSESLEELEARGYSTCGICFK